MSSPRSSGPGRILVAVYAVLAVAAVVYLLATLSLAFRWDAVAWVTIAFELAGVLVIGTLSVVAPAVLGLDSVDPFGREATVWSAYGAGYLCIPLVLPIIGLLYLWRRRGVVAESAS